MSRRPIRAAPPAAERLRDGFDALRAEVGVPGAFPEKAIVQARAAASAVELPDADLTEVEFVTIDPPGARDLDQALHVERLGDGFRVRYAIADLSRFVVPGGALDAAVWERGVTYYAPDLNVPLHPRELSEGAASLLPGETRPAIVFTLDLRADGALARAEVARARVRSRAQLDYAGVQADLEAGRAAEPLALLAEVGALRQQRERRRGGVTLPLPAQEVVPADGGWSVEYRAPLPVEGFNAQISLLAGMAAADLMLRAGAGILRTLGDADERALARLRRTAAAVRVEWPRGAPYPQFIRSLDPSDPAHAAVLHEATGVMRGAGYAAFDGEPPSEARHAALAMEYAHVTAPLRRLADRYALECTLAACAGKPPPDWVRSRLAELPDAMAAGDRRASALERGVVDLVEAVLLEGRVGEEFRATVVDEGLVRLADPAVRAKCDGDPPVGEEVTVRLTAAEPATRTVRFTAV